MATRRKYLLCRLSLFLVSLLTSAEMLPLPGAVLNRLCCSYLLRHDCSRLLGCLLTRYVAHFSAHVRFDTRWPYLPGSQIWSEHPTCSFVRSSYILWQMSGRKLYSKFFTKSVRTPLGQVDGMGNRNFSKSFPCLAGIMGDLRQVCRWLFQAFFVGICLLINVQAAGPRQH